MDEKSELLYAAAVGYMVSSRTNQDSWASIAKRVQQLVQQGHTYDHIAIHFLEVEKKVKEDFSLRHMPAAWRTAKHTVLKAVQAGVGFVDLAGNPLGKTAVDKACSRLAAVISATPEQQWNDIYARLANIHAKVQTMGTAPFSNSTKDQLVLLCNELHNLIDGLPAHA